MVLKRLPTDKTIVTELKIHLADIHTRNRLIMERIAVKVPEAAGLKTGDATLSDTVPLVLSDITSMIYVYSWGNFLLQVTNGGLTTSSMECGGAFLYYGAIDGVSILAPQGLADPLRLSYIYA